MPTTTVTVEVKPHVVGTTLELTVTPAGAAPAAGTSIKVTFQIPAAALDLDAEQKELESQPRFISVSSARRGKMAGASNFLIVATAGNECMRTAQITPRMRT